AERRHLVHRRPAISVGLIIAAISLVTVGSVTAAGAATQRLATTNAASSAASTGPFPTTISLPDGFSPEGIAIGPGPFAYFGSRADGSIYRADLVTGAGRIVSPPTRTPSLGL